MSNAKILYAVRPTDTHLPYFDVRIPAGFPSPALDHMEYKLSLDELLDINAPHKYVPKVSGDSMTGAGIFDGDCIIVSRARESKSRDIVAAYLNGEIFVKRLGKSHGSYVLQSEHPDYPPRQAVR